ncbi:spore coat U domain-containing protein [Superficieibacter sp. HKU1]|uniref:Csu type fimbrial protein n=1 Tax=Superficieibacter sp. HKU1 TaxID=3031919 RepID=UPI0023E32557|nr:spore coat U domain-containing protein [Superficieibacter sp. HKU1]WES70676.1 spore coat U domain-containing protein [Superficieibacter sp. HKU1]
MTNLFPLISPEAVTTQSFQVNASIVPGCSVIGGAGGELGTLNFGTRSGVTSGPISTRFVPDTALSLACTPGVALSMSINGGQHYTTVRNLQRTDGTEQVPYRLYSSSSLAADSEIGVNQAVTVPLNDTNNVALTLFGVAQLTGLNPAGVYNDRLTVTLSW